MRSLLNGRMGLIGLRGLSGRIWRKRGTSILFLMIRSSFARYPINVPSGQYTSFARGTKPIHVQSGEKTFLPSKNAIYFPEVL